MHFEYATDTQLITVVQEDCSLDYRYQAMRELRLRQFTDDMLPDLLRLWGEGMSSFDIAIELGIPQNRVEWQLQKYGLYKRRVSA